MTTKIPFAKALVLSLMAFAIVAIVAFSIVRNRENSLGKKQEELALKLGVGIEDYPYRASFPEGYFYTVLKPGMPSRVVHTFVKDYEQVFSCYGTDELYYYFSSNDQTALRFMVHYDNDGKYVRLYGEDDDSRTLSKSGCIPGLLEE